MYGIGIEANGLALSSSQNSVFKFDQVYFFGGSLGWEDLLTDQCVDFFVVNVNNIIVSIFVVCIPLINFSLMLQQTEAIIFKELSW